MRRWRSCRVHADMARWMKICRRIEPRTVDSMNVGEWTRPATADREENETLRLLRIQLKGSLMLAVQRASWARSEWVEHWMYNTC